MADAGRTKKIAPLFFVVGFVESANILWRDILKGARPDGVAEHPIVTTSIVFRMRNGFGHQLPARAGESAINDFGIAYGIFRIRILLDEVKTRQRLINFDQHFLINELRTAGEAVKELASLQNDEGILRKREGILDSQLIRIKIELCAGERPALLINGVPVVPAIHQNGRKKNLRAFLGSRRGDQISPERFVGPLPVIVGARGRRQSSERIGEATLDAGEQQLIEAFEVQRAEIVVKVVAAVKAPAQMPGRPGAMILREPNELLARRFEMLQILERGPGRSLRPDRGDRFRGAPDVALKGAITEKGKNHAEEPNRSDHARCREQGTLQEIGAGTAAAGSECSAVLQNDVAEDMAKEQPLCDFPGFGRLHVLCSALPVLRGCFREIIGAHDGSRIRRETASGRDRRLRGNHRAAERGGSFHKANASEIETTEKRTGAQLARATEVHQKLRGNGDAFLELTRKFIDAGELFRIALSIKQAGAAIREGIEHGIEGGGEPLGLLLGKNSRSGGRERRKRSTENLRGFAVAQVPKEILKVRQAVGVRAEGIRREADAQRLRNLLEPCANGA